MAKRMRIPSGLALLFAAVGVLLAAGSAPATVVARVTLPEMARQAASIVHGTVIEVRSGRDARGVPATWVTLAVARTVKGPASARVTLKQFGTAAPLPDGTLVRIAGLPRYAVGDEVVLFLRAPSRRGFTSPVGLAQGAYRVQRGRGAARVRGTPAQAGERDLGDFLAEVARLSER